MGCDFSVGWRWWYIGSNAGEANNEQGEIAGWHTQGCVCDDFGWEAQTMGDHWAALCGLGDLSREGIAGGPEPVVCVTVQRLVWAGDSTLERRRHDLGTDGEQVCV